MGFVASFIDDSFVPGGERLLEPVAELLGELAQERQVLLFSCHRRDAAWGQAHGAFVTRLQET